MARKTTRTTRKTPHRVTSGALMLQVRKTPVTGDLVTLRAALNAAIHARQRVMDVLLIEEGRALTDGAVTRLDGEIKQLHAACAALDEAAAPVVVPTLSEALSNLSSTGRTVLPDPEPRACACGRYLADGFEECSTCAQ